MPRAKKELFAHSIDASRLSRINKNTGVYSERFPTTFWEALDAATNTNPSPAYGGGSNSNGTGLVDPYTNVRKASFEDTYRSDKVANKALKLLVQHILGKQLQTVTDSRQYFATEELRKQAVEGILSNTEYQEILVKVKQIDGKVKLQERLVSSQMQKYVYGRSVLGVVKKEGLPVELKQFSSKNLGNTFVDKDWKLAGVEYEDILIPKQDGKKRIFKPKDILYFTNADYNITPNTLYYGQSLLEGVAPVSVWKRIILEEDGPETTKGHWAGVGIIKAPGITSQDKLTALINAMDPGKWNVINADITAEVHKIATELAAFPTTIDACNHEIIRGIGVPMPLMGYEDVTNRATMQEVMQVFKETTLEFERTALQSQLDSQWYDTILMELTGIEDIDNMEYKICLEFQDIVFDTFKDKCEAVQMLRNMNMPISDEAYMEMLGLDNLIDEIEDVKAEIEEKETEKMEMQAELLNKMPKKKPFE